MLLKGRSQCPNFKKLHNLEQIMEDKGVLCNLVHNIINAELDIKLSGTLICSYLWAQDNDRQFLLQDLLPYNNNNVGSITTI